MQEDFSTSCEPLVADIECGEHGSTEAHLAVTSLMFSRKPPFMRFWSLRLKRKELHYRKSSRKQKLINQTVTFDEIDNIGRITFTGKLELSAQEGELLKDLAKRGIAATSALSGSEKETESCPDNARI